MNFRKQSISNNKLKQFLFLQTKKRILMDIFPEVYWWDTDSHIHTDQHGFIEILWIFIRHLSKHSTAHVHAPRLLHGCLQTVTDWLTSSWLAVSLVGCNKVRKHIIINHLNSRHSHRSLQENHRCSFYTDNGCVSFRLTSYKAIACWLRYVVDCLLPWQLKLSFVM